MSLTHSQKNVWYVSTLTLATSMSLFYWSFPPPLSSHPSPHEMETSLITAPPPLHLSLTAFCHSLWLYAKSGLGWPINYHITLTLFSFNLQNSIRECGGLSQLVALLAHPSKTISIKAAQVLSNLSMNERNQEGLKVMKIKNSVFYLLLVLIVIFFFKKNWVQWGVSRESGHFATKWFHYKFKSIRYTCKVDLLWSHNTGTQQLWREMTINYQGWYMHADGLFPLPPPHPLQENAV